MQLFRIHGKNRQLHTGIILFLGLLLLGLVCLTGCGSYGKESNANGIISNELKYNNNVGSRQASDGNIKNESIVSEAARDESILSEAAKDESNVGGISNDSEIPNVSENENLDENGYYTSRSDVALYIHIYNHLPDNFMTKKEAESLGWQGGGLDDFSYGSCIGGGYFGNYEGVLPEKDGRKYYECDIDTMHSKKRGGKRLVYSNDGLIYYTEDHYETFELLYGEE